MAGRLSPKMPWELANPRWAALLNPLFGQVTSLQSVPLISGYQINSVALVANTPKTIPHSLGVIPEGWVVVDQNASASIWRQAWTSNSVTLEASANVTISFWIY